MEVWRFDYPIWRLVCNLEQIDLRRLCRSAHRPSNRLVKFPYRSLDIAVTAGTKKKQKFGLETKSMFSKQVRPCVCRVGAFKKRKVVFNYFQGTHKSIPQSTFQVIFWELFQNQLTYLRFCSFFPRWRYFISHWIYILVLKFMKICAYLKHRFLKFDYKTRCTFAFDQQSAKTK